MPALNVNTGKFVFDKGSFNPKGSVLVYGDNPYAENPRIEYGKGVFSGLIIMGLSGRDGEEFALNQVVEFVKGFRISQVGDPGSSFIMQRGIFKHKSGEIVEEDSVRVILLNITGEKNKDFQENILAMAEEMRERFNQEEIIVEFQNKGVTKSVYGIKA